MQSQKIRIRLKAFDYRLIDQSTRRLLKRPSALVLRYADPFRCPRARSVTLF